jgi:hypothetical protein
MRKVHIRPFLCSIERLAPIEVTSMKLQISDAGAVLNASVFGVAQSESYFRAEPFAMRGFFFSWSEKVILIVTKSWVYYCSRSQTLPKSPSKRDLSDVRDDPFPSFPNVPKTNPFISRAPES